MKIASKRGRPVKDFDQQQFEELCAMQCTEEEILGWFYTTDKTLSNWIKRTYDGRNFSEVFNEKRCVGKISLRRSQFQMAKKNATMAIWLGKQYLGQSDSPSVMETSEEGKAEDALSKSLRELAEKGLKSDEL